MVAGALSVLACPSFAQLADSTRIIVQDGWIEKMDDNIILKVGLNNNYETFVQKTSGFDYSLYPNITTNVSIGLDYRFISASFEFAPKFFPGNGDDDIYGKTDAFSFGLSTIFRHWAVAAKYTHVTGYYLQNTPDFDPLWQKGDPYFMLPETEYKAFTATVGYSFNSKLSMRSLTTFTERQLKSTGSFIPTLNLRYFLTDRNDKPIGTSTNQKTGNFDLTAGPSYFYNYVLHEKFFASAGAHIGAGIVHTKLTTETADGNYYSYQNEFALRWDAKAGLGYNGRDFFTGFYVNISDLYYNQDGNTSAPIQDLQAYYQFVIGVRLASPKWLKNQMKKLDEKVKL
jgi:hypothetical protein